LDLSAVALPHELAAARQVLALPHEKQIPLSSPLASLGMTGEEYMGSWSVFNRPNYPEFKPELEPLAFKRVTQ
jgi:hypothetical protein